MCYSKFSSCFLFPAEVCGDAFRGPTDAHSCTLEHNIGMLRDSGLISRQMLRATLRSRLTGDSEGSTVFIYIKAGQR